MLYFLAHTHIDIHAASPNKELWRWNRSARFKGGRERFMDRHATIRRQSALARSSSTDLSTRVETKPCPGTWDCLQYWPFELRSHLTTTLLFCSLTIADQWDRLNAKLCPAKPVPAIPFIPVLALESEVNWTISHAAQGLLQRRYIWEREREPIWRKNFMGAWF